MMTTITRALAFLEHIGSSCHKKLSIVGRWTLLRQCLETAQGMAA